MEKIKVRLYCPEDDCYNELWKEVDGKRYFARNVWHGSTWYYVCDPLGYRELDYPCEDELIFVVCDQGGNRLFENGNAINFCFPSLEQAARQRWDECKYKYLTHANHAPLSDWLLSHMTPENLAKDPVRTQFCPSDNWTACWYEEVKHEAVEEFEYLGDRYCIWAITYKHLFCDCGWVSYFAGAADMDWEYPSFVCWFADSYDASADNFGPMYSKRKAVELVSDALKTIYDDAPSLSMILTYAWIPEGIERSMSYRDAADFLIGNDLSRTHVHAVVEEERLHPQFYSSIAAIRKDYPHYRPDFNTNIWR